MKIKKILVSQPQPSSGKSPYFDIANRHGVEVVFRPFIKVEGLSAKEFRQQKINISDFTAVIFTARTAIDHFFRLCEETRVSVPDTMKYFCTNEQIALYLQKYITFRKRRIFFGSTGKLDGLVTMLQKHNKEKFLYVVSDVHDGADVAPLDEAFDYDMLLFFSPSGIESLKKNFPDFEQGDIRIGVFGPTVAKAVKDSGLRLDLEAPTPGAPSMTTALDLYLAEQKQQ